MKEKLSYKSKRNIIIAAICVVLVAIISIGTYFYVKSDNVASAQENNKLGSAQTAYANNQENNQIVNGENNQIQNQSGENNNVNNGEVNNNGTITNNNGTVNNGTANNNGIVNNNGTTVQGTNNNNNNGAVAINNGNNNNQNDTGTTTQTTGNVPNQDYVSETVEEQEVLVSEDFDLGWKLLDVNASIPTDNLFIIRPIFETKKTTNKTAVVSGEKLEYTITVSNIGNINGKTKVRDDIPEGTTFVEGSIKVNGNVVENTAESLKEGIEVEVNAGKEATVSFEVTVNEDAKGTIKNKATVDGKETEETKNPVITFTKKADKETVKAGENIKYTITIENTGDVEGKAIVKDDAPEGTTLVEGSLKVNESSSKEDIKDGIEIEVPAKGKVEVSFEVVAEDLEDGAKIENTAKVNEKETNKTETTYQEAIITAEKTSNKTAVAAGEDLEYTITVSNTGSASGNTIVKDEIPEGTTFVEGSIKINGNCVNDTAENLKEGIEIGVPANGKTEVSFVVIVNEDAKGTIKNKATVDGEETEETKNPVITFTKKADKETVKAGENIKYTITVENTGDVEGKTIVKDDAPEGTTLVEESLKVNESSSKEDLKEGIEIKVPANGKVEVSFEVVVNNDINIATILNTAKVNGKETTAESKVMTTYKVEHYYKNNGEYTLEKTDNIADEYEIGTVISEYEKYENDGFKYVKQENLPLTLQSDVNKNIIKVYYAKPNITATKISNAKENSKFQEGETVIYTIKVKNSEDVLGDATITDEIPEGLIYQKYETVQIGNEDSISVESNILTWNVKSLGVNEEREINIETKVGTVESEKTITNNIKVDGNITDSTDITATKVMLNYSKTAKTMLERDENGVIIPGQNENEAEVGDTIVYTIKVENKSDVSSNVDIKDPILGTVSYINDSLTVNGNVNANASFDKKKNEVVYAGTINPKETINLEFKVKVENGAKVGENITNTAYVNGNPTETTKINIAKKVIVETTAQTVNALDLVLVLDVSGSMEGKSLDNLKNAATNLVNKVFSVQTDSTITLITYSDTANAAEKYDYSTKKKALEKIKKLQADGGTNIYEALNKTNSTLDTMDSTNRTHAVVFFTDGAPTYYCQSMPELVNINSTTDKKFKNNLRKNIVQEAIKLKARKNTMVYAVGLGIGKFSYKEIQYEERNVPNEDKKYFDGNIYGTYYMTKQTYGKYVLNNIDSSNKYIESSDLDKTFDDILKKQTTTLRSYNANKMPVVLNIPEKGNIISDVVIKIGDSEPVTYKLTDLNKGKNGISYVKGTGFTWTINDANILNNKLHISYTIDGVAQK